MKKLFLIFIVFLFLSSLINAQIGVKEVISQPKETTPGEKFTLMIILENVGSDSVENIAVKLDLTNLPFAPVESATEQVIGKMSKNERKQIIFNLITLADAEPRIYKIPLKISYDNISKDALISINVKSEPKLDLVLESSEIVKVNDNGKIIIKIVNLGLTEIKTLRLTLLPNPDYEILSANTIYINNIDVEDFETAEFTLISNAKNPKLIFNLNYKDKNNEEYAQNKEITLNVYTLEEAKQLGLVKRNIYSTILISLIILILLFFIYRRLRKRKI